MKVLIVGHYNSVFIQELKTQITMFDNSISIDILDIYEGFICQNDKKTSFGNSSIGKKRLSQNIQLFKNLIAFKKYAKRNFLQYNSCNIQYLDARYRLIFKTFRNIASKLIITTYGSDFYRFKKHRRLLIKFYNSAEVITFANEQTKVDFNIFYKNINLQKFSICRFGLSNLDQIEKLKTSDNNKNFYKTKAGFDQNKVIITIGYSSNPNSQQIEIVKQIAGIQNSILKKIFFVFPMTYGGFVENITNVEAASRKLNLDYTIIKDFLNIEQLGYLRLATDIMIHLPLNDQLSGAMQENLFCGNVVITGNWLPYNIFDEVGVSYYKIDNLKQLNSLLTDVVENIDNYLKTVNENSKKIWNLSSWENNIRNWIDIYKK